MTQVFRPRSTTWLRIFLAGVPLLLLGTLGVSFVVRTSQYLTDVDRPLEQPVPFSHKHHVTGLGIDCRYCHTTVETSAFAGLPSTHTCMSCHSQIWTDAAILEPIRRSERTGRPIQWIRVYRLPDHVYFNHGVHISRGLRCDECHGPVGEMPLLRKHRSFTMRDCLSCHEPMEKALYPATTGAGHATGPLTSCYACHR